MEPTVARPLQLDLDTLRHIQEVVDLLDLALDPVELFSFIASYTTGSTEWETVVKRRAVWLKVPPQAVQLLEDIFKGVSEKDKEKHGWKHAGDFESDLISVLVSRGIHHLVLKIQERYETTKKSGKARGLV